MKNHLRRLFPLLLVFSLASLGACGGEEGKENQGANGEENQNGGNGELISQCDPREEDSWSITIPDDGDTQDFQADYDMRMDEFTFISSSPGAMLNGILGANIENQAQNYPVVILLEFRDIDLEAGTFKVRGGAGLKAGNDGDYRWDDDYDLPEFAEGEIHESGALYAELPNLNFVATVEGDTDIYKSVIPIRDLELDARLQVSEDGKEPVITDGNLRGLVIGEEAEHVTVEIGPGLSATLSQALQVKTMNFDNDCDGEADSWQMTATFSAAEVSLVE